MVRLHERTTRSPVARVVAALVSRLSLRAVRARRRARCRAPTAVRGLLSRATVRGRRPLRGRAGERRVRSARGALRGDHARRAGWWPRSGWCSIRRWDSRWKRMRTDCSRRGRGRSATRTGEISRLIVAPDYRAGTIRQPLMLFGLFRHLYEECWRLDLGYLVAGMEGSLARLLRRLGFLPASRRRHQLFRRGGALRRHAGVDAAGVREHPRLRADLPDRKRARHSATSA